MADDYVPTGARPARAQAWTTPEPQDELPWERAVPQPPADSPSRAPGRLARESAYLLLSWPVLLAGFVVVIVFLAVGAGLVILWVGLLLLAAGLLLARLVAGFERAAQHGLLARVVPPATYPRAAAGDGVWRRLVTLYRDGQSWADVGFTVIAWFVATITWSITVVWWTAAVAGLVLPIVDLATPPELHRYLAFGFLLPYPEWVAILVDLGMGVLAAVTLPVVVHALASVQSGLFGAILGASALRRRVTTLETSRRATRDAEASALRRLERDLHDGPQQRLVRLQMDLGRALHQLDSDPGTARSALESSLDQARGTLAELRGLSRGIAPPVLADRGLVAALDELTARSAIPTTFTTDLPRDRRLDETDELPPSVAHAAFYLVSEGLTNAAKHGGARSAAVDARLTDGALQITVRDDGAGGARIVPGGGLAGLVDRVAGLDGTLSIASPAGGPTVLTAVLPCR